MHEQKKKTRLSAGAQAKRRRLGKPHSMLWILWVQGDFGCVCRRERLATFTGGQSEYNNMLLTNTVLCELLWVLTA